MINVTVINLKSITKYLVLALVLICIFMIMRFISKRIKIVNTSINLNFIGCLEETLPRIQENDNTQKIKEFASSSRGSKLRRMLNVELPMMDNLIVDGEENDNIKPAEKKEDLELAQTGVKTEEIQENNITPRFNGVFGTVKIKNESDKEITESILTPNISLENNKDVVIFHTHTCESYTPSEKFNYQMTGSYRTTDLNYSVARVGTELEKYLKEYGYNVIHDQTYHDYPAYSGSYGRSLTTVENVLKNSQDAQVVIDLHRDAVRKQCKLCTKCKNRR